MDDMNRDDDRIIELEDEDGTKERFLYLTTIDHEDRQFAILTPEEPENEEEEAIVILEILTTEDSDDIDLVSIEDDDLADAIFEKYTAMCEEEDEGEDEE